MLLAFPVLALIVLAALLAAGGRLALAVPQLGALLILAVLPMLWPVLNGIRHAMLQKRPEPTEGAELTRSAHPQLWHEVDGLTRAMRQPPVERIVAVAEVNAAVTEHAGHRELIIGLPMLALLSRGQLRAVLAHELGHFVSGHTRAALRTYRAGVALSRTAAVMHRPLGRRVVNAYVDLYLRISMPVLRSHEYRADQWSAALAGSSTAADSLIATAKIDVAWSILISEYVPGVAGKPRTPSMIDGLRHLLAGPVRAEIDRAADEIIKAPGNPLDTHPAPADRIERLRRASTQSGSPNTLPALSLLADGDPRPIERALGMGSADISWDEAIAEARFQQAAKGSKRIMARLSELQPAGPISVRGLLDAVASGRGPALVAPFLRGDIPSDHRAGAQSWAVSGALQDAVLDLLADHRLVQIRAGWDGEPDSITFRRPDGSSRPWPLDQFRAAAGSDHAIGAARAIAGIRDELIATGVDLDAVRTAGTDGPPPSIPVAALTVVIPRPRFPEQRRDQAYDVIAYDDGLLLAFVPGRERGIAAGLRHTLGAGNDRQLRRVEHTIQQVDGRPAHYAAKVGKAARWVPYPSVAHAFWRKRRRSLKWELTVRNARPIEFQTTAFSEPVGNLQESVANAVY